MVNDLGFGKVEGKSVPVDCKMHASIGAVTAGWACSHTDCAAYGKWYCPFSW